MTDKQIEINGVLKKYWDNSSKRAEGKRNPDNIILNVKGAEVEVAVWAKEYGKAVYKPNILRGVKEGDEVIIPAVSKEKDNIVRYSFDWTRDTADVVKNAISGVDEAPTIIWASEIKPAQNTVSKDDYWVRREETDRANQKRIAAQWAINASIEALKLTYPTGLPENQRNAGAVMLAIEGGARMFLETSKKLAGE